MQFKIPQNVQREDTIFLNVTFKQLLIMLVGGGFAYSVYIILARTGQPQAVAITPAALLALLTLAIAFLKIRDMTFLQAVLYFIEYSFKPKVRYWKMGAGDVQSEVIAKKAYSNDKKEAELSEQERRQKLLEISKKVNRL